MEARLGPLTREITQEQGRTKADLDRLYRKMVTLVTLRAGQGNPTDAAVLREATAALTSVFPQVSDEKARGNRFIIININGGY